MAFIDVLLYAVSSLPLLKPRISRLDSVGALPSVQKSEPEHDLLVSLKRMTTYTIIILETDVGRR